MPFDFFENGLNNGIIQPPNDYFRNQQQAAIDQNWDVTTAKYTIKEQLDIGSDIYNDIEVWINYVIGMTSRGLSNGDDFRQLLFKDINHQVKRGLYYQFDSNYWITYFTDAYSSVGVDIGVRRCNNIMRIIDPQNGSIFTAPCVVEYDMSSPYRQVNTNILTPNNHATIMVQGNSDTLRLFKLNTRYILGGRPFKLLGQQNALLDESISATPTLIYLDLYLDELHAKDDIEHKIADNGDYSYTIAISADDMELTMGSEGKFNAIVALNGQEVNRQIQWKSSDSDIAAIDGNGDYKVVGVDGQQCTITANLNGNPLVADSIKIKIADVDKSQVKIIVDPSFERIRQYETIAFEIKTVYGSQEIDPDETTVSLAENTQLLSNNYLTINKNGNNYQITSKEIAHTTQTLYIHTKNNTPQFESDIVYPIEAVSMLG